MKTINLLFLLCFVALSSFAQKVDLDREYIKIKYINLPTEPILDAAFRTYSVIANNQEIAGAIEIHGFEKMRNEGTLNVDIKTSGIIIDNVEIKKREKENKDKEGNVTSISRYYKPVISYHTVGSFSVKNASGKSYSSNQGSNKNYKGKEYNSYTKASQYYKNNSGVLRDKFTRQFISDMKNTVNRSLNKRFGYAPYVSNDLFWILDSKKNSEYEGHKKAAVDMKALLGEITNNEPIDVLKPKLQPIVDYFLSVIPKFSEDKKKHRKMKYASYYNIGRLYYHFDMPEKAIEFANKLIENDYDKSDGKKLIKQSERLKELFEINKVTSRHFSVETVDNSFAENTNTNEDTQMQINEVSSLKKVYFDAFVITKTGEKIEGKVETVTSGDVDEATIRLPFINKYIKLYILNDDDDDVTMKKFYAKDVNAASINNVAFESVYFTAAGKEQSQGNVVDLDAAFKGASSRFCKVIYKSDKIGVYAFQNELILKKPADKKASSTSSLGYIMAFKKKLSKYIGNCEELVSQVKAGEFENTEDSLTQLAKEYTENCK